MEAIKAPGKVRACTIIWWCVCVWVCRATLLRVSALTAWTCAVECGQRQAWLTVVRLGDRSDEGWQPWCGQTSWVVTVCGASVNSGVLFVLEWPKGVACCKVL